MVDLTLLSIEELEDLTKCSKPCKYNVFSLAEEAEIDGNGTKVYFSLASKKIISKKEVYLYTFSSLIAELGGALGLFLGFSFYMLWDLAETFYKMVAATFCMNKNEKSMFKQED